MWPCRNNSSENHGLGFHFAWLWHYFVVLSGTKWHSRGCFGGCLILDGKKIFAAAYRSFAEGGST